MTHTSHNQSPVITNGPFPTVARLLEQGINRCTSESWTVRAIDTRPQAHSETDQLLFGAIVQHDGGDTIQVEPVPKKGNGDSNGPSGGYAGTMRVSLQRGDEASGKYVRLQGRAAGLNPDRPVARTLLYYADGVKHPNIDEWTGFEEIATVHADAGDIAESVTYETVTEVLIAIIGAARSVPSQQTQVDLSAFT